MARAENDLIHSAAEISLKEVLPHLPLPLLKANIPHSLKVHK